MINSKCKLFLILFFVAISAMILPGCPAIVVGAAAGAAATAIVYDHRTVNAIMQDNNMGNQVFVLLHEDADIKAQCHIVVSAFRGSVLLAGQAPTEELRERAVTITKTVSGIKRIYNEITIEEPTTMTEQSTDSWITSKVKTQLLATKGLSSSHFKVVTENGTVFLIGEVTRDQSELAVNAARHVEGVQKVVKIFDYTA
jgi:osmotically-inducible protein OsmY